MREINMIGKILRFKDTATSEEVELFVRPDAEAGTVLLTFTEPDSDIEDREFQISFSDLLVIAPALTETAQEIENRLKATVAEVKKDATSN